MHRVSLIVPTLLAITGLAASCSGSSSSESGSATIDVLGSDGGGGGAVTGRDVRADTGPGSQTDPGEAASTDPGPADAGFGGPSFGLPCTGHQQCEGGWCVEAAEGNLCTVDCVDHCPTGWSCQLVRLGGGEDQTSVCIPGADVSACDKLRCDDNEICTFDSCDPKAGCTHTPQDALCSDGSPCTVGDVCVEGVCAGSPRVCNDAEPCTDDSCDPQLGCVHTPNAAPCDDGLSCSVGDRCEAGRCSTGTPNDTPECRCERASDCPDSANVCPPSYACLEGWCVPVAGTHVVCDTSADTACRRSFCNVATGLCEQRAMGPEVTCDDGDHCTDDDRCDWEGSCVGALQVCDDGHFCNGPERCEQSTGRCAPGYPPRAAGAAAPCAEMRCDEEADSVSHVPDHDGCNDGNPCTHDRCDPTAIGTGASGCVHQPNAAACDDNDPCTQDDACREGRCTGTPGACTCETDSDCLDDGAACAGEIECHEGTCRARPGSTVSCTPSGPCVRSFCVPEDGSCREQPVAAGMGCDDGDTCTTADACDGRGSCRGRPLPCDDGLFCNGLETCAPGLGCRPGSPPKIEDEVTCTVDLCDEWADAVLHLPNVAACNDNNACTDDACDPTAAGAEADGCVHGHGTAPCSDGDRCTFPDSCAGGLCRAGASVDCDDSSPCTQDSCDPALGCVYTSIPAGVGDCPPTQGPDGFAHIPAGEFWMGTLVGEPGRQDDEGPRRRVEITRAFWLKTTEVTQAEWNALLPSMGGTRNPSAFPSCGEDCPVDSVDWWESLAWCNAKSRSEALPECYDLSSCTGEPGRSYFCTTLQVNATGGNPLECEGYRLPTEAEWEYAARAGTEAAFYNGEITQPGVSPLDPLLDLIGWYGGNSAATYEDANDCSGGGGPERCGPQPVALKLPNAWGLHDAAGNVNEWVWDLYGAYPAGPATDPLGGGRGSERVWRGGSWSTSAAHCRSAARLRLDPAIGPHWTGFRPARTVLP